MNSYKGIYDVNRVVKSISDAVSGDGCKVCDGLNIKGDSLAAALNSKLSQDEETRSSQIKKMASAAGISESTVGQILNGSINCPPKKRLIGFAKALNVSASSLVSAAKRDGCTRYENDVSEQ